MLSLRFFHLRSKTSLAIALCCALLLGSLASQANQRNGDRPQREQPESRQEQNRARISASQAASLVQQQYGGKVMNVQTRQNNGRVIYSVKILSNSGHMRTVNVDGHSGAILN